MEKEGWTPQAAPLARWDELPDIDLYMDQVITWLKKQLAIFQDGTDGSLVTPAIINNYVKGGVAPRPVKKKYGQSQLAALTMACVLKRALPIQQVKKLTSPREGGPGESEYDKFCQALEDILFQETQALSGMEGEEPLSLAMHFALRACVDEMIAQRLLALHEEKQADASE